MSFLVSMIPQYRLLQWAADALAIPHGRFMENSHAVGVLDEQRTIRAVMVLNKFSGEGCEASFVSDGSKTWLTATVVAKLISIPFEQFRMRRVVAHVGADAIDTQIAALRIGFMFEARLRAGMPNGDDAILFSMLRNDRLAVPDDEEV